MRISKRSPTLCLVWLCVVGALVRSSTAVTHTVLWSIPTTSSSFDDWASKQTFQVGDVLVFNYAAGTHNVLAVSPKDAATCDISNPTKQWDGGSPTVSLDSPGAHTFICGFPAHCSMGMKLTVEVSGPPSSPPPQLLPPPANPPPTPATPELPSPPPKRRPLPPPQPQPEAPAPSPPKKKRPRTAAPASAPISLVPAPAPSGSLNAPAPAPTPTGAASGLRSTALVIGAAVLVSCWALLF